LIIYAKDFQLKTFSFNKESLKFVLRRKILCIRVH